MSDPQGHGGCVALIGATGFVGRHLLRRLTDEGWRLRALTRRPEALGPPTERVQPVVGDLESDAALTALIQGADVVVHCAGLVAARDAAEFHRVNAEGTARLLRAAAAAGRPRFLLISSLAAREPQLSPYAASKRQAEELLRQNAGGLTWQALRPPVVYGFAGPIARHLLVHEPDTGHAASLMAVVSSHATADGTHRSCALNLLDDGNRVVVSFPDGEEGWERLGALLFALERLRQFMLRRSHAPPQAGQ